MKLYTITDTLAQDVANEELFHGDYWAAIWSKSEESAMRYAAEHYNGECRPAELTLRVASVMDCMDGSRPTRTTTYHERRLRILRLAGWMEEGERECVCCGLHALGDDAWQPCAMCELCQHCAADSGGESCGECGMPEVEENEE